MSQYLLIPRLEVKNANAQPAWWIIGPPPMTAYAGFAQALALSICENNDG
ncbi:MAG TPA: type I-F CRISPR-associated protein Csy2, partial [Nitrospirae bacterium]|nr:type I-F CRISPR-associated protein Csy2 [Nitrospirota bacterium]